MDHDCFQFLTYTNISLHSVKTLKGFADSLIIDVESK
jgi:hypothetical protein